MTRTAELDINRFLHQQKPLWNIGAVTYTVAGYLGGIALLLAANGWLNAIGVCLLTHSLVLSAYPRIHA
jgi:hypothetical protein